MAVKGNPDGFKRASLGGIIVLVVVLVLLLELRKVCPVALFAVFA